MADFSIAYNGFVAPSEGYYGWLSGDSGGETYAGIARNYNTSWPGWTVVDSYKKTKTGGQPLPNNTQVPGLDQMVTDYYKSLWVKNLMDQLVNQDVANIFFDMVVNAGGNGVKLMQKIVGTTQDGIMGPKTVAAINSYPDQNSLNDLYKQARETYYRNLATSNPNDAAFLTGWLNRLEQFPTLSTGVKIGAVIVGVLLIFALIMFLPK